MLKSINIDNSMQTDEKLSNKCFVKLEKLTEEKIAHETRLSRKENEPVQIKKSKRGRPKRVSSQSVEPIPVKRGRIAISSENENLQVIPNSNEQLICDFNDPKFNRKWTREDFLIGKKIGHGRFGRCYLVKENRTQYEWLFVLKILSKKILIKNKAKNSLKEEYDNQRKLSHPNVLRLYGFFDEPNKVHLILEYAPKGNLYELIQNNKITNNSAAKYSYQTTNALIYLHSHNIIHRDLKPENLLIGYFDEIKLADFGWSIKLAPNCKDKCIAGTIDYLCPEMLEHKSHNSKVDNWCLGVLCYELLVGSAPFHNSDCKKTYEQIKQVSYNKDCIPNNFAQDLINSLLKKNPEDRLELTKVIKHDWIEIYADKSNEYEKYFFNSN